MKESTKDIILSAGFDVNSDVEVPEAAKFTKDMKEKLLHIENISRAEIKTLVNLFYQMQDIRKQLTEQIRSIDAAKSSTGENNEVNVMVLQWALKNMAATEKGLEDSLKLICMSDPVGRWLLKITGIGPVLAAGCLCYFDISNTNYATQFHSYAGLNDNNRPWLGRKKAEAIINEIVGSAKTIDDDMVVKVAAKTQWPYNYLMMNAYDDEKGRWSKADLIAAAAKIPYNKSLKCHMWKIGKSFQWVCNKPESLYGRLFNERRVYEQEKNDNGDFADQAAAILAEKNIGKNTTAYKEYSKGRLPAAHINARAMRWTEKIFLSHLFEEMYRVKYDKIPPRYYALEHLEGKHNKEIEPEVPYDKVSGED